MKLTVVGSSDAFNSAGRCHSCYLVEGDGYGPIMIDFGGTALSALRRANRSPTEIAGFAITHLHGDHVGGFPFLFIDGMFNELRSEKMDIVGPKGTSDKLDAVFTAAYETVSTFDRPYEISIRELSPGGHEPLAGMQIRGFAAEHMDPPHVPLCLQLIGPDKTIAFSGDTAMCDGLFEAAKGADILVAECSAMRHPAGRHCTWEEWRGALGRVEAKRIVLTHLNKEVRSRIPELLEEAPKGVDLSFAEDGLVLEI